MQPVIDFLWNLGGWNWFILAVVMLLLESMIPGIHFMWFGMAAVALGAITLFVPMSVPLQLVLFALIAIAMILLARRFWAPQTIKTDVPELNIRGHQYVGRTVTVEEAISNGRGKVRVGDTLWTAEGPDTPVGTKVKVTGVNGTVLVVSA
jgi:membrane protein implicated in regulation of membrane protease activity